MSAAVDAVKAIRGILEVTLRETSSRPPEYTEGRIESILEEWIPPLIARIESYDKERLEMVQHLSGKVADLETRIQQE